MSRTGILVVSALVMGQGIASAQSDAERRQVEAAAAAESAERMALAKAFVGQREADRGRPFDAAYRTWLERRVASASMDELRAGRLIDPKTVGDSDADLVFTPIAPCRVIDTRLAGGPIAGGGGTRDFYVAGSTGFTGQGGEPTGCGVPDGPATAAVVNITVVSPAGPGNLRGYAWATPAPTPPNAALVTYGALAALPALSNGITVPMCDSSGGTCTFDVIFAAFGNATDIVVDVVGYFNATVVSGGAASDAAHAGYDISNGSNITGTAYVFREMTDDDPPGGAGGTGDRMTVASGDRVLVLASSMIDPVSSGSVCSGALSPCYRAVGATTFTTGESEGGFEGRTNFTYLPQSSSDNIGVSTAYLFRSIPAGTWEFGICGLSSSANDYQLDGPKLSIIKIP